MSRRERVRKKESKNERERDDVRVTGRERDKRKKFSVRESVRD